MRSPTATLVVAWAAGLGLACQSGVVSSAGVSSEDVTSGAAARPAGVAPASLEIEVLRGFAPDPLVRLERQVVVLADLREEDRTARQARADRVAAFARALPDSTAVEIHVVGDAAAETCSAGGPIDAGTRAATLERLAATAGGGPGSLAGALDRATEDAEAGDRVVAFADARDPCADLCAAALRAAERGVWVDWVVPQDASPPACLDAPARAVAGPGPIARALAPGAPVFHVRAGSAPDGAPLASGRAGDRVDVAPGELTVWLDLEPREAAGPLDVAAGERLRVRVLDFPMTDPPVRRWWIEREGRP